MRRGEGNASPSSSGIDTEAVKSVSNKTPLEKRVDPDPKSGYEEEKKRKKPEDTHTVGNVWLRE